MYQNKQQSWTQFQKIHSSDKSQQKTMHPTAKACCFPSQKSVQMVSFSVLQSDDIPPHTHTHTHTFCMCTHPCVCVYMYMYVYVMGVCGQLANTLDDRSSQGFTPLAPRQENVFLFFSVNNWADSSAGAMETQRTYKSWTVSCAFASRQKVHFTSFMWSLPVRTVISIMPPFIFREGSDRNCQNPSP